MRVGNSSVGTSSASVLPAFLTDNVGLIIVLVPILKTEVSNSLCPMAFLGVP